MSAKPQVTVAPEQSVSGIWCAPALVTANIRLRRALQDVEAAEAAQKAAQVEIVALRAENEALRAEVEYLKGLQR